MFPTHRRGRVVRACAYRGLHRSARPGADRPSRTTQPETVGKGHSTVMQATNTRKAAICAGEPVGGLICCSPIDFRPAHLLGGLVTGAYQANRSACGRVVEAL